MNHITFIQENEMKTILAKAGSRAQDNDAFQMIEQDLPQVGETDLRVRVGAVGMNPVDTKVRQRSDTDLVLGWDAWGIVEECGGAVTGFKKGDAVYYAGDITRAGTNSEYHLVDYRIAAPAPKTLSPADAAAIPLTAITAWEALFDRMGFVPEAGANAGKSLLIIGGAGGVGSMAIQLAAWAGFTVFATASRPETAGWCRQLGAGTILNHRNDLHEELTASGTETVDAIFCTTQLEHHWAAMAQCIRPQGRACFIDDPENALDITLFKAKSVSLSWEFMYTRSMFATPDMAEQGALLSTVAGLLDQGTLVTTRRETFTGLTVENIQAMHIRQESGAMVGKQVLVL